jgi:hypothetical protein
MPNHERYEECLSRAALGEASAEEWDELQTHLSECATCHSVWSDMQQIHSEWFPERRDFEIKRDAASETRMRRLVLQGLEAEGAKFSDAAIDFRPKALAASAQHWTLPRPWLAAAAGILLVLGLAGIMERTKVRQGRGTDLAGLPRQPAVETGRVAPAMTSRSQGTSQALDGDAQRQKELEVALNRSELDRRLLERRLGEAERKASDLEGSNSRTAAEVADLKMQLASVRSAEAQVEQELAGVKAFGAERESQLILTKAENRDLREEIAAKTASVEQEGELMADGREIRDLIAARNLHIIDVYDTNGDGRTQKAFGRVFYTEGKSLVFYAYDLNARRTESAKYAYYAWGKRDASEQVVRNLGIFYNDDQKQKRWVLTIKDPQMLSEIDSVFVTLEPMDKLGGQPSGKKVLSAFLGSSPNHP